MDDLPRRRPAATRSSSSPPASPSGPPCSTRSTGSTAGRRSTVVRGVRLADAGPRRTGGPAQPAPRDSSSSPSAPAGCSTPTTFGGSTLDGDWSWAQGRVGDATVSGGLLRWPVEHTDLYVDSDTASVLVRDAPRGDYVVQTKVRLTGLPDEGCCFNYAQAGLVIYGDDDNFVKLTDISIWETRQTEFAKELDPGARGVEPLRQHRRRPARRRLDLAACRRRAAHRRRASCRRRGHRAVHGLHEPGRRHVGARRRVDAPPPRCADRPGVDGSHRPGDRTDHRRVRRRAGVLAPGRCPPSVALDNVQPFGCMFVG